MLKTPNLTVSGQGLQALLVNPVSKLQALLVTTFILQKKPLRGLVPRFSDKITRKTDPLPCRLRQGLNVLLIKK